MEIGKLTQSRKEREIFYWANQYDQKYPSIDIIPIADSIEIDDNIKHIKIFKEKYPFYSTIMELVKKKLKKEEIRFKIISEIISYLDVVKKNGNILIEKETYKSISKKKYSIEKADILKDLKMMLYEAILNSKITQKKEIKIEDVPKKEMNLHYKKPGRKQFSELAVIALKYHILQRFQKKENPYSQNSRFDKVQDFYEYVAQKENLNLGSFMNKYKEINREKNLDRYCKSNPKITQKLYELNCFENNKECSNFLSQYISNSK